MYWEVKLGSLFWYNNVFVLTFPPILNEFLKLKPKREIKKNVSIYQQLSFSISYLSHQTWVFHSHTLTMSSKVDQSLCGSYRASQSFQTLHSSYQHVWLFLNYIRICSIPILLPCGLPWKYCIEASHKEEMSSGHCPVISFFSKSSSPSLVTFKSHAMKNENFYFALLNV